MAYNLKLAQRLRESLIDLKNIEERNMFGGICFMLNDKMCIGISNDDLMCRFNPEITEEVMHKKGARPMDFTNRVMKGFVFVDESGYQKKNDLEYWIKISVEYNAIAKKSPKKKSKHAK